MPIPWIGYNIQGMKFFVYIYLTHPEELIFETSFRFEMDLNKLGSLGTGSFEKKVNLMRGGKTKLSYLILPLDSSRLKATSKLKFSLPSSRKVMTMQLPSKHLLNISLEWTEDAGELTNEGVENWR